MKCWRLAVACGVLAMVSCGVSEDGEEEESAAPTAPKLVGRIASVNEARRFVLIEGYGDWRLGEGLLLSSFGPNAGRSANLVASGERMGRYAAADWRSGELEVGDEVFARPMAKPEEAETGESAGDGGVEEGGSGAGAANGESGTD